MGVIAQQGALRRRFAKQRYPLASRASTMTAKVTNLENTVFSIKRFMGHRYDEVQQEVKLVPYRVVKALTGARESRCGASSTGRSPGA